MADAERLRTLARQLDTFDRGFAETPHEYQERAMNLMRVALAELLRFEADRAADAGVQEVGRGN